MDANCTSKKRKVKSMETVYIAGGCLWGVQHFFDTVPGVRTTEAGRANGTTNTLDGPYDGYAECVKVVFDEKCTSVTELMEHLFEIIDPYSLNKQGVDVGKKYRTGLYSTNPGHLEEARAFIDSRKDRDKIVVEVLPLTNYVRSAEEHQHHLERYPEDCSYCHIPDEVLNKYRNQEAKENENAGIGNDHQCAGHCDGRCAGYFVQTLSERALSGYNHQSHGLFRGVSGSGGNALQDTDG